MNPFTRWTRGRQSRLLCLYIFAWAILTAPLAPSWADEVESEAKQLATAAAAEKTEPVTVDLPPGVDKLLKKQKPSSVAELRLIEEQVRRVSKAVIPCTVGVRIGASQGSGVIISEDGYVLTAGHVAIKPGLDVVFILPNGKQVKGKSLGVNRAIDSGLMKIEDPGPWPYVQMAAADSMRAGDWVISTGHPGGFVRERSPVLRLGRVLFKNDHVICTDCTLVGGDSGGPLFDLQGRVIGIHSRIGWHITTNFHVPIATYHDTWDRLVAGEAWGGSGSSRMSANLKPLLGVAGPAGGEKCLITQVFPGSPAARAGIQPGDVVLKFDGRDIKNFAELAAIIKKKKPGDQVQVELQHGSDARTVKLRLAAQHGWLPGGPGDD